jgi:hypothetical protein
MLRGRAEKQFWWQVVFAVGIAASGALCHTLRQANRGEYAHAGDSRPHSVLDIDRAGLTDGMGVELVQRPPMNSRRCGLGIEIALVSLMRSARFERSREYRLYFR